MEMQEKRIDEVDDRIEFFGDYKRDLFEKDMDYRKKVLSPFKRFITNRKINKHTVKRSELCKERIIRR